MQEESVHVIRESTRNLLKLNRRNQRDEDTDANRRIDKRATAENVAELSNKLKTKSSISASDLQMLKNALIDNSKHIETVLNTHGALRGIVREITGNEVKKQCAAAGCCCNLALGDARAGVALAKAAGPYLVAALDNLATELAVTCIWALGNIAGSGPRACNVLIMQGSLGKLVDSLANSNQDIVDAALYALVHFAYQLKDDLSSEYLHKIQEALSKLDISTTSSQLLFLISCHQDFSTICLPEEYLQKLLEGISVSIKQNETPELVYLLRTLANVNEHSFILNYFVNNNMIEDLRLLLENEMVNKSLLWLLGNLYARCNDSVFFKQLLNC